MIAAAPPSNTFSPRLPHLEAAGGCFVVAGGFRYDRGVGYSAGRAGGDSRCCHPVDPPWEWVEYTDADHQAVREIEDWLKSLAPFAREHELGRVDDLLDAAARGELEDTGDARTPIVPVRYDPEIYELRHRALTKNLRFYHGEPRELSALVAVHRHIKVSPEHQQRQIEHAAERYSFGRSDLWGTDKQP